MDAAAELLKLAEEKFGKLRKCEKELFRAVANGEPVNYSSTNEKKNDPAKAAKWGPSRILKADRIAWLCTDKQTSQLVTHRGILIEGARIDDRLDLMFAKIAFPLYFKACKFTADINLLHAQIAALNMEGTHTGPISADGLKADGSVNLRDGFKAEGEVRLLGAMIGGDLDCENGQFINKDGDALSAHRLKVEGTVFLRDGFKAEGRVAFVAARIDRDFRLNGVDSPEGMTLDLNSAKIGTLHDREDSWPSPGRLLLHGLEYKEISNESPTDSKSRIEWLRLQDGYWPQPYEQLAKVLRESGDDVGAKEVLIAKNEDKAERTGKLTWSQTCWYYVFGPLIGYGHKPLLAMRWAVPIIVLGWLFFFAGYSRGLITPPSESAYTDDKTGAVPDPGDPNMAISGVYPVFNSLFYSIDTFVPVVDFHQGRYWLPNANRGSEIIPWGPWPLCWGGVLLFWLWLETICGWVLTTLFLVGFTGLVRT